MTSNLDDIKTDKRLLDSLKQASTRHPTKAELLEQRVSFIYGSISDKSDVTREEIRRALVDREGN